VKAAERAHWIAAGQRRIDRWGDIADQAAVARREAQRQLAAEKAGLDWLRQMPVTDEVADPDPGGPS
jgi:hypothetical protein